MADPHFGQITKLNDSYKGTDSSKVQVYDYDINIPFKRPGLPISDIKTSAQKISSVGNIISYTCPYIKYFRSVLGSLPMRR